MKIRQQLQVDLRPADLAHKIAEKALDIYKREVDASYSTFEYYSAKTGRGAGWHQFAGLTAPVINWFSSYYKPGTVTTGFEIWIDKQSFNTDLSSYKGNYSFDQSTPPHHRSLLICMNPAYAYKVSFNGKNIEADNPYPGMLQITLPATNKDASLIITPIKQQKQQIAPGSGKLKDMPEKSGFSLYVCITISAAVQKWLKYLSWNLTIKR